jgi:predicted DNA-binding mobile mystery protein A
MLSSKLKRARRSLDERLVVIASAARLQTPRKGWLHAIREAIGMNGQQYADRLHVAWQSMSDLERSEAAGTISLNSLRKGAAALNCRLIYAVVPEDGSTLDDMVNQQARDIAQRDIMRVNQTMKLEDQEASSTTREAEIEDYIAEYVRDSDLWSGDASRR